MGITVVAAAGNAHDDACEFQPSASPNAITVGGEESLRPVSSRYLYWEPQVRVAWRTDQLCLLW